MRHLQTYRIFEASQSLTDEQKEFLDKNTRGTWSLNPSTGKVDVEGNFGCVGQDLKDFKGISFGSVSGSFDCFNNELRTLFGSPETVWGSFDCRLNSLQTLEGAPRTVGGQFNCSVNSLGSLEGAPRTVGGSFDCYNNSLRTLVGAPETVGEDFECRLNDLQTFKGAPETVGGEFYSDEMEIPEGEWSQETLVEIFTSGTPKQNQMIKPVLDLKVLQQMIDQNPEKMLVKLKDHLKDPHFKDLKWPERLEGEKDLLSNLSDIGL